MKDSENIYDVIGKTEPNYTLKLTRSEIEIILMSIMRYRAKDESQEKVSNAVYAYLSTVLDDNG
jgi:endonuclease III